MIQLNDYLYSGDTVMRILKKYTDDLKTTGTGAQNSIDLTHANFLLQLTGILEHNDFLTNQSNRIHEFYNYMANKYPYLAFIFKGRIKSLIRAEEKFNGYVVSYTHDYYKTKGQLPPIALVRDQVTHFRDLIAYRIVISLPQCHVKEGQDRRAQEILLLYRIAGELPAFMEEMGFTPELSSIENGQVSPLLPEAVRPYYKDYVANPSANGYRSLHITFYDNIARCYIEMQLRTKEMDDEAEIGTANHFSYENKQKLERERRDAIPEGLCPYFDEAYERGRALQKLDLSQVNVNMFTAKDNHLINDCCGLLRGRLILPFEHLSRFQTD